MNPQDLILLVFVAGLFLLMWNNGRKRKKAALEVQNSLAVGVDVSVAGVIFGKIVEISEDKVTISSRTSTLVVAKRAVSISPVQSAPLEEAPVAAPKKPAKTTKPAK